MEFTNEIYEAYKKMVFLKANKLAQSYHMQPDDLIGDGMEIFYKAVEKFDPDRGAKLSTYLYHQLKKLNDSAIKWTCSTTVKKNRWDGTGIICDSEVFEETLEAIDFTAHNMEFLDSIATELSPTAQTYLNDLFSGVYAEPVGAHRPTIYPRERIAAMYNISIYAVDKLREEIKKWWKSYPKDDMGRVCHNMNVYQTF